MQRGAEDHPGVVPFLFEELGLEKGEKLEPEPPPAWVAGLLHG